jgi:carbamoyl-phosphate synthase large subunit
MKSVGEVMAIGRTFAESLQKALRGLETGLTGLDEIEIPGLGEGDDKNAIRAAIGTPTPDRLRMVAQALAARHDRMERCMPICKIDPWFLAQIEEIIDMEQRASASTACRQDAEEPAQLKAMGFSDARLARSPASEPRSPKPAATWACARSTSASTPAPPNSPRPPPICTRPTRPRLPARLACEARVSDRKKVVILGGGPNRIGQGIEFDYCCCHAAFALKDAGYEAIMVNCNPETVSTDYDTSDRLYFEPLTAEDVLEILTKEQARQLLGVIVQFGGQTPLKLADALEKAGIPILGTSPG